MFEGLIISHDPYFSALFQERLLKLIPSPAILQIQLDERKNYTDDQLSSFNFVAIDNDLGTLETFRILDDFKVRHPRANYVIVATNPSIHVVEQAKSRGATELLLKPQTEEEWQQLTGVLEPLLLDSTTRPRPNSLIAVTQSLVRPKPSKLPGPIVEAQEPLPEPAVRPTMIIGDMPVPDGMVPFVLDEPFIIEEEETPPPIAIAEPPPVTSRWRISFAGELQESFHVVDQDLAQFFTHFIYLRMADITVALETVYFTHVTLYGPEEQQVLVSDPSGIHHATVAPTTDAEAIREQFIIWCCEQAV